MRAIVALCLRWRVLVLAFVAVVAAVGVREMVALPIDAVPDITNVQVQVLTRAPARAVRTRAVAPGGGWCPP